LSDLATDFHSIQRPPVHRGPMGNCATRAEFGGSPRQIVIAKGLGCWASPRPTHTMIVSDGAGTTRARRKPAGGFQAGMGVLCGLGIGLAVAGIVLSQKTPQRLPHRSSAKGRPREVPRRCVSEETEIPGAAKRRIGALPTEPAKPTILTACSLPKFEMVVPETGQEDEARYSARGRGNAPRHLVLQAARTKFRRCGTACVRNSALKGVESKVRKVSVPTTPGTHTIGHIYRWTN